MGGYLRKQGLFEKRGLTQSSRDSRSVTGSSAFDPSRIRIVQLGFQKAGVENRVPEGWDPFHNLCPSLILYSSSLGYSFAFHLLSSCSPVLGFRLAANSSGCANSPTRQDSFDLFFAIFEILAIRNVLFAQLIFPLCSMQECNTFFRVEKKSREFIICLRHSAALQSAGGHKK